MDTSTVFLSCIILLLLVAAGHLLLERRKKEKIIQILVEENKVRRGGGWEEEEEEKYRMLQKRIEISVLQSQINPHFLYNTLDSIRSKAISEGQDEVALMTEKLSRFFRYCISNEDVLVKIREELNYIRDYYYIQKYRFEERIDMQILLESDEINELYIPRMTLQPLVENAMIHGLEKKSEKGLIILEVAVTEHHVVVTIRDNGNGMTQDKLEQLNERLRNNLFNASKSGIRSHGIALTNINSRIKVTFGDDFGIHYRSKEGEGTAAELMIPRIDEFTRVKYENYLEMMR